MKKFKIYVALSMAVLALLAACGGGGDSTPATAVSGTTPTPPVATTDVADKYIGTWTVCVAGTAPSPGSSSRETLIFTKASATSIAYAFTQTNHTGTVCTSTPTSRFEDTGTSTFVGTKTVGSMVVDTAKDVSSAQPTVEAKGIYAIAVTGQLRVGDDNSAKDANGYPTALDTQYIYAKQ